MDLGKLDLAALKRYKRHYRVRTKHNSTKAELVQAITRHFASQPVMDMDSISFFIYAVKNQGTWAAAAGLLGCVRALTLPGAASLSGAVVHSEAAKA